MTTQLQHTYPTNRKSSEITAHINSQKLQQHISRHLRWQRRRRRTRRKTMNNKGRARPNIKATPTSEEENDQCIRGNPINPQGPSSQKKNLHKFAPSFCYELLKETHQKQECSCAAAARVPKLLQPVQQLQPRQL